MDVRAAFPLTLRYIAPALDGDIPDADTREEFVRKVCDAFSLGNIPHRAARDVVRYEAYVAELSAAPAATPDDPPQDSEPCRLASHVRLHTYGADLRGMLRELREGRAVAPKAAHGWVVLFRDGNGARRERWLTGEQGWQVESFREPTAPEDVIEEEEDRALFLDLWRDGVLTRA